MAKDKTTKPDADLADIHETLARAVESFTGKNIRESDLVEALLDIALQVCSNGCTPEIGRSVFIHEALRIAKRYTV